MIEQSGCAAGSVAAAPHLERNRRAWDERVRLGKPHTEPASGRDFENPLATLDQCGWLDDGVVGKRVLCLAAGGGRHGVLFAALGAQVTVVDLSPQMLALDRKVAGVRGLQITTVEASMESLPMLLESSFDLVIQPVSTCYVPDLRAVYREVARVTRPGGLYISQHKQPVSLQTSVTPAAGGYVIGEPYYRNGPLPEVIGSPHRETGTVEFFHRLEELLGGICRNGFVIEDLVEPRHFDRTAAPGTFEHRSFYIPPYITCKARRVAAVERKAIWVP